MLTIFPILLLLMSSIIITLVGGIAQRNFIADVSFQDKISNLRKLSETTAPSAWKCAAKCQLYQNCVSLFYNKLTEKCQFHDIVLTYRTSTNLATQIGSKYYKPVDDCMTDTWYYTGDVSQTVTGKSCQVWTDQSPHGHAYTNLEYFLDNSWNNLDNRCRDPTLDHSDFLWCYTSDPASRWEKCSVPICPGFSL